MDAISLGIACATRFQIMRHNYLARHPSATVEASRASKFIKYGETHIFDWQVTPLPTVTAYIDRDFDRIFEREDLEVAPAQGIVRNRRLHVEHNHAFSPLGRVTEADIDAQYSQARSKIEYLAGKFRRLLDKERGPLLYVVGYAPPTDEVGALLAALRKRAPQQQFHVAFIGKSDEPIRDLSVFGDCVSQFRERPYSSKPVEFQWQGDDASWDDALRMLAVKHRDRASGWRKLETYWSDLNLYEMPIWIRQPRKQWIAKRQKLRHRTVL
jgi:hypothetical protein